VVRTHTFGSFVKALDLRSGRLAAGTGDGEAVLFHPNGTVAFNASLPMSVRSLQLSRDGDAFLVGGSSLAAGDLSGALAFVDTTRREPLLWVAPARGSVGLVGLDDAGLWALSVEESPPHHSLRVLEAATGTARWTRPMDGFVARDDSGSSGGAALAPDGRHVVVGTLRGDLLALRISDGRARWSFHAEGTTQVAFARDAPDLVLSNGRLVTGGAYSTAFLFSADQEPLASRLPVLAAALVVLALLAAGGIVGIGYWRAVRRAS
jgi:outer membrane protein assembly factor BamB